MRHLRWLALGFVAGCEINPAFDPDASPGTGEDGGSASEDSGAPWTPLEDPCPPLPPPTGPVLSVAIERAAELPSLVAQATEGTTIVLEPGTYWLDRSISFNAPNVTLRSSTGRPEDVVLDGQRLGTIIFAQQPGTTIAELTLRRSGHHLVHVTGSPSAPAGGVVGYRLHLVDPGLAAFKINPSYEGYPADDGTLACSSVRLTQEGREELADACPETAGVVGYGAFGWTIRDNTVEGFWCPSGLPGAAIRFLEASANQWIERNAVRDCAIGIMLGLWEQYEPVRPYDLEPVCGEGYFDHMGGVVRNNTVVAVGTGIGASEAGLDTGIGLWNVCDATVVHNTVASAVDTYNAIEYRFPRTQARVVNNLVTHDILDRDDAGVPVAGNAMVMLNEFVAPLSGDVHLVEGSTAIDAGVALGEDAVPHDIDGDPRDARPDIGADER